MSSEREAYMAKVRDLIQRYGWFHQSVGGGDNGEPSFSYTVGLHPGSPELIVQILGSDLSSPLFWALYEARELARATGLIPVPFVSREGEGMYFWVQRVHPAVLREDLTVACYLHEERGVEEGLVASQVVWPDEHGRWPWESEADEVCRRQQNLASADRAWSGTPVGWIQD